MLHKSSSVATTLKKQKDDRNQFQDCGRKKLAKQKSNCGVIIAQTKDGTLSYRYINNPFSFFSFYKSYHPCGI
jgi:hypothetical protein